MGGKTRVPQKDSEFDTYIRDTGEVLQTGTPTGAVRLGLSIAQATAWANFLADWIILYPKYTNPATRTTTITKAKNKLKKDFTVFAEKPLKTIEASENLTDDDRGTFNLPEPDRTTTSRGQITEAPIGSFEGKGGGLMKIRVRRAQDATRSSMHPLADVVEFRYIILDSPTSNPDSPGPPNPNPTPVPLPNQQPKDFPLVINSTKALWIMDLGVENKGKYLYGLLRWVNQTDPRNNSGWIVVINAMIT